MLSRVARRVYWLARYIERAENTARLVNTYNFLLLDLPRGTHLSWDVLPRIIGNYTEFAEHYQRHDERNTVKFLLLDDFNPGSLANSVKWARENTRTSREVLPGQAWEQINELHLFVRNRLENAMPRRDRFAILTEVIQRCQQITGLLAGTMSHDYAYDFVRIGRNLERADMTTRVIDIGAMSQGDEEQPASLDIHVWTSVLRTMNAYQMYRRNVQIGVLAGDVIGFLLHNSYFPRSVAHCLDVVEECVGHLPLHKDTLVPLREVRRRIGRIKPDKLQANRLQAEVDRLQTGIADINDRIHATWFE